MVIVVNVIVKSTEMQQSIIFRQDTAITLLAPLPVLSVKPWKIYIADKLDDDSRHRQNNTTTRYIFRQNLNRSFFGKIL